MAANRANAAPRSYENFDPESELLQEEGSDTVAINLPGFKKEELKVALTDPQNLKITGVRNLGDNKWSRFEKNVPIPDDGDVNRLKAKFDNGVLYIIMPHQPRALTTPTSPPPPQPLEEKKPATEPKPQVPPKPASESPPSQKPETSLQKPASEPQPAPKPETKSKIPPETDLQKPPSGKPVSEPKVQPEPSKKPVYLPETPVQPKPTQVDQQKNEKVGEPTAAPKAQEKDENTEEESETTKAKEGGGDADDGGARVKNMSFGGRATAATFASDLTTGLYKPKQLIINVVVGVLVVLALVIYVRHMMGRRSFPGATDE